MNINDLDTEYKKNMIVEKMKIHQIKYYELSLDYKSHVALYEKFKNNDDLSKELANLIKKLKIQLDSLEECFKELKKEYDNLK